MTSSTPDHHPAPTNGRPPLTVCAGCKRTTEPTCSAPEHGNMSGTCGALVAYCPPCGWTWAKTFARAEARAALEEFACEVNDRTGLSVYARADHEQMVVRVAMRTALGERVTNVVVAPGPDGAPAYWTLEPSYWPLALSAEHQDVPVLRPVGAPASDAGWAALMVRANLFLGI